MSKYEKIFNLNIPVVNQTTGNVLNYVMKNISVKRNMYISKVTVNNLSWFVGDSTSQQINYTFSPDDNNVAITKVEYTLSDNLKDYLTYNTEGHSSIGGHVIYNVVKNPTVEKLSGTLTVKVTDVNGKTHSGTNRINLWKEFALNVDFIGNDGSVTYEGARPGQTNSAQSLGQVEFSNNSLTVDVGLYDNFTLRSITCSDSNFVAGPMTAKGCTYTYNGDDTDVNAVFTIVMNNTDTNRNLTFTISGVKIHKNIYINNVLTGGNINHFIDKSGNTLTITYTTTPTNSNVAETSARVIFDADSYLTLSSHSEGTFVYNISSFTELQLDKKYKIEVTDAKGKKYTSAESNLTILPKLGVNFTITGDNNVIIPNLDSDSTTDGSSYTVEYSGTGEFTILTGGISQDTWQIVYSTESTGISLLSDNGAGTFRVKAIEGVSTFKIGIDIKYRKTDEVVADQHIYVENINIKKNIFIDSIQNPVNDYFFYTGDYVNHLTYIYYYPVDANVDIMSVVPTTDDTNITFFDYVKNNNNSVRIPAHYGSIPSGELSVYNFDVTLTDKYNNQFTTDVAVNGYYPKTKAFTFNSALSNFTTDYAQANCGIMYSNYEGVTKSVNVGKTLEFNSSYKKFTIKVNSVGEVYKLYDLNFGEDVDLTYTINDDTFTVTAGDNFSSWSGNLIIGLRNQYSDEFSEKYGTEDIIYYKFNNITIQNNISILSVGLQSNDYTSNGLDRAGTFELPIVITPSNYTIGIESITATLPDSLTDYATITSVDKDKVVINVPETVQDTVKEGYITLQIKDVKGIIIKNSSSKIRLTNNATHYTISHSSQKIECGNNKKVDIDENINLVPGQTHTLTLKLWPEHTTSYFLNAGNTNFDTDSTTGLTWSMEQLFENVSTMHMYISLPENTEQTGTISTGIIKPKNDFKIHLKPNETEIIQAPRITFKNLTVVEGGYIDVTLSNENNVWSDNDETLDWELEFAAKYIFTHFTFDDEGAYLDNIVKPHNLLSDDEFESYEYLYFKLTDNNDKHLGLLYKPIFIDNICKMRFYLDEVSNPECKNKFVQYLFNKDVDGFPRYYGALYGIEQWNTHIKEIVYNKINFSEDYPSVTVPGGVNIIFNNCTGYMPTIRINNNYVDDEDTNIKVDCYNSDFTADENSKLLFITDKSDVTVYDKVSSITAEFDEVNYAAPSEDYTAPEYPNLTVKYSDDTQNLDNLNAVWGTTAEYIDPNSKTPLYFELLPSSETGVYYYKASFGTNNTSSSIANNYDFYYKINDGEWKSAKSGVEKLVLGDKIYIKNETPFSGNYLATDDTFNNSIFTINDGFSAVYYGNGTITNPILKIGGNITSLNQNSYNVSLVIICGKAKQIKYADLLYIPNNFNCGSMFLKCVNLITLPNMSNMTSGNFVSMFSNCTSLTTPPDMSNVTSIGDYGCSSMFYNCTSLTTPPDMSNVTSIGDYGCSEMFSNCTSLTTPPDMSNVTSIGSDGCSRMFYNCTSLTTPPDMSNVTSIYGYSFSYTFFNCVNLKESVNLCKLSSLSGLYNFQYMYGGCSLETLRLPLYPNSNQYSFRGFISNYNSIKNIYVYGYCENTTSASNGYDKNGNIVTNLKNAYRYYFVGIYLKDLPNSSDINVYIMPNSNRKYPIAIKDDYSCLYSNWNVYFLEN